MTSWYFVIPVIGISILALIGTILLLVPRIHAARNPPQVKPRPSAKPPPISVPIIPSKNPSIIPPKPPLPSKKPLKDAPTPPQSAPRYACDYLTGQCVPDPSGDLTSCDKCEKQTYYCDPATWSCRDVGFLRDSATECRKQCFPDLRIRGDYTAQRADTHANGSGAFCDQGRYRKESDTTINNTNVSAYEWVDMSCVGYRCCESHYCDPSGQGVDSYSDTVCPGFNTETTCVNSVNREVPAYCEWTGSACQATTGTTSACAACTTDDQCPGEFGAFKCESGVCVAQGQPKCDTIHKEYRTDEVIPDHMRQACIQMFDKDSDTMQRLCADISDGDTCAATYFDRTCVDRYGKTWLTERSHCGARSAPAYPSLSS